MGLKCRHLFYFRTGRMAYEYLLTMIFAISVAISRWPVCPFVKLTALVRICRTSAVASLRALLEMSADGILSREWV
jgi:hypothetical protein